ncbi:uncharacterized protein LOC142227002 [Haematobia irritans]|uniref:uncharacterized protein LOC142227002 n=1 Tax=Haematobia irritans TaxID=7368 RepID=UPI003F4F7297
MFHFITFVIAFSLVYVVNSGQLYKINSGNEYFLETGQKYSWYEANRECHQLNMKLISIDDEVKQQKLEELYNYTAISAESAPRIWTSGNSLADGYTYKWRSTGQQLTSKNWGVGEPNKYDEHCIAVKTETVAWFDAICGRKFGYVCENTNGVSTDNSTNIHDMVKYLEGEMEENYWNVKINNKTYYEEMDKIKEQLEMKTSENELLKLDMEILKKSHIEQNKNFEDRLQILRNSIGLTQNHTEKILHSHNHSYEQQIQAVNNQLEFLTSSLNKKIDLMKREHDRLKGLFDESIVKLENHYNNLSTTIKLENAMQEKRIDDELNTLSGLIKINENGTEFQVDSLKNLYKTAYDHVFEQFKNITTRIENDYKQILSYINDEKLRKPKAIENKFFELSKNVPQNDKQPTHLEGKTKFQSYNIYFFR